MLAVSRSDPDPPNDRLGLVDALVFLTLACAAGAVVFVLVMSIWELLT